MKHFKFLILVASMAICGTALAADNLTPSFRDFAPTPPMGWNSWDCYGPTVVESEVYQNANYMAKKLKDYGWEYVVVDIRWFVENDKAGGYNQTNPIYDYDAYGRYTPASNRFPSAVNGVGFKALADSIHKMGLKFGIHIMRGVPKLAVNNKMPIYGTSYTCDQIYKTDSLCTWLGDNYSIDCTKPGAQDYYNSIFNLYASWGVDFVKIDDLSRPYHDGEIWLIRKAIDQCGRPMVLSMSPGKTPIEKASSCQENANMWRMMDDYWDLWSDLQNEFDLAAQWASYSRPGNYPDCDMLPLGEISIRGERGSKRWTNFTKDEQNTMMNLWGIFHSPLFFGGDLTYNDAWTDSLLTNKEYMYMHSTSTNYRQVSKDGGKIIWSANDPNSNNVYVALFNTTGSDQWIYADQALYRTETISYLTSGYGQDLKMDIPDGSKYLALVVDNAGDGYSYDHGDWINPTLIMKDGTELALNIADTIRTQTKNAYYKYVVVDRNITKSGKLDINGTDYDKGFACHANTMILFKLPENVVGFKSYVGIDRTSTSQSGAQPTMKFMVFNCDPTIRTVCDPFKAVTNSGYVSRKYQSAGVDISADITGASKLYLVVTDGDDNFNYDHADWVNPILVDKDGNETSLTTLTYASAKTDWQNIANVNKNVDGGSLNINGTSYTKGIGTNSNAIIIYNLPTNNNYVTFKSKVGYDYAMKNAANGVTMEFMVFTSDPTPNFKQAVPLDLTKIGIDADQNVTIKDIWSNQDLGIFKNSEFAPVLNQHASGLYLITPGGQSSISSPMKDEKDSGNKQKRNSLRKGVYSMNGDYVSPLTDTSSLKNGMYIVNGDNGVEKKIKH